MPTFTTIFHIDPADHTRASKKLLIVLSVHAINDAAQKAKMEKHGFINIRHQDLMDTVRTRLPAYMEDADDRHLLYLQDYFSSIQQLYQSPMATQENEAILAQFHQYKDEIWRLEHESAKLMTYVTESTIEAMKALGYFCESDKPTNGKHFRKWASQDPEGSSKYLRFWIWIDGLRLYGDLHAMYEVHGDKHTALGVKARKALQDRYGNSIQTGDVSGVSYGQKGGAGSQYCQLFRLKLPLREADGNLAQRIQIALQRDFIDAGYLQAANDAFFNAKNSENAMTPYPKYKDSGIEWIGEIPAEWSLKKLKYSIAKIEGGGTPSTENAEFWGGSIPWISSKDMKVPLVITEGEDFITEAAVANSSTTVIEIGSILNVMRSGIATYASGRDYWCEGCHQPRHLQP